MSLPDRPDGLVTLPSDWPRDLRRPAPERDRIAEIKARMVERVLHPGERADVDWLIAEVERLRGMVEREQLAFDDQLRDVGKHRQEADRLREENRRLRALPRSVPYIEPPGEGW